MAKEREENMDAELTPYPCQSCGGFGGGKCSNIKCPKWIDWFNARWKEVTQPFLPVDK